MGTNLSDLLNRVHHSDCVAFMKTLPDNCIDSIVTDPPYHLVSIVKRFGKEGSAPAKGGKDGSFKRLSGGFMGKTWDGVDENGIGIAQSVEMRGECLRILKPGGYLLSFSGTRTYHRMACAIEDAGFEVRDMIEWVYGSGFPKSLNIGKAVDKLNGIKTENKSSFSGVSETRDNTKNIMRYKKCDECGKLLFSPDPCKCEWRFKKSENEWSGWGTALKPAHEPICMARKPIEGTVAENCLKWGTGGINIDESRVETEDNLNGGAFAKQGTERDDGWGMQRGGAGEYKQPQGRFPANLIWSCYEDEYEYNGNEENLLEIIKILGEQAT